MLLYHGTSVRHLKSILKRGIVPRGARRAKGNWSALPSRGDSVYLTDAYPLYFAFNASTAREKEEWCGLVLEVELDRIKERRRFPDEDVIGQAIVKPGEDLLEVTRGVDLDVYQSAWPTSLAAMGTMSIRGKIPVSAITRYAIIDWKRAPALAFTSLDPSISILNYTYCAEKYRDLTRGVFNRTPISGDAADAVIVHELSGGIHVERPVAQRA